MTNRGSSEVQHVLELLRPDALAAMIYGSTARGDSTPSSDVDVLQLSLSKPGRQVHGRISLVTYLPAQLEAMTAARSLFAWHLRSEGQYLLDGEGRLRQLLEAHPGPDPDATIARVHSLTAVLDVDVSQFRDQSEGLAHVARYLLRTAVYASALRQGAQTFALEEASRLVDPSGSTWATLIRLCAGSPDSWSHFQDARTNLARIIGPLDTNPYRSLEALAVRTELSHPGLASLTLHALSNIADELDYGTMEMPVL